MTNQVPFRGITVAAIEQAVAAPLAHATARDLGARVTKLGVRVNAVQPPRRLR